MSETRDWTETVEAAGHAGVGAGGLASLQADLISSTRQPLGSHPGVVPRLKTLRTHLSGNPKGKKKAAKREFWRNFRQAGSGAASSIARRENRFDPRGGRATAVPHPVPTDVDAKWAALGQEFGFLPIWNGIAVIEYRNPTYVGAVGKVDGAPRKAARLMELLAARKIDDFTLVVAVPKLPAAETDLICEEDVYVIEVPDTFWAQDAAGRIAACRELVVEPQGVDHLLPSETAEDMRLTDRVVGQYSGRNPDLDEQDVEEWRFRVFGADRVA